MFETLNMAPPDPILGLSEAFRNDPNPQKINLSVGVYKDGQGRTPTLQCVRRAEQRLVDSEANKSYLDIEGLPEYGSAVRELLFGASHEILHNGRAATVQTPGGTGALRVAADLLMKVPLSERIWCSQPTWANHANIFSAAGLRVEYYPYFHAPSNSLAIDDMLAALRKIPPGETVLLHACCHNPTGIDPTPSQWQQIGDVLYEQKLLPLVDFAYQGFGDGLEEDGAGLRELCRPGRDLLICSSFSKNFGLYSERVGALTIVAGTAEAAQAALSHAKVCVRANYSNPPKHGALVVSTILADDELRSQWHGELAEMRSRINGMRQVFAATMKEKVSDRDFSFVTQQRGMFSYSGLTPVQVDQLRREYAIYIVGSGRINVAGITEGNLDRLCDAVKAVL